MFRTVRFGNDHKEIFNLDCCIVNLILEIRKKCRIEEDTQVIDLTDETGGQKQCYNTTLAGWSN